MKKIIDYTNKLKLHINPKLRRSIVIYAIILMIMAGVSVYHLTQYYLPLPWVFAGLVTGCLLGIFVGRMYKISRDTKEEKVIGKIDLLGGIVLAIYISIELGRKRIFGHWIQGDQLQVFTFLFLTGIFVGRIGTIINVIKKVLDQEDKLPTVM